MTPRVSIVVPAYNEGERIIGALDHLLASVTSPCEVLVVYDTPQDSTAAFAEGYARKDQRVLPTLNTYGRGPARAIRFGIDQARAGVIVVTMADGSDDVTKIDPMVSLVEGGAAVVAASRYMRGGEQRGGPLLKRIMSRTAGLSLYWLARVGTHDPTNSFKAYAASFMRDAGIESDAGFEIGIELVAKARRLRLPVKEIPAVWLDRTEGESNFKLAKWLRHYLRWYVFAFGPRLRPDQLARRLSEARS
ncbi:MAG: glycosyltransferase [Actinomycetota bacterium]